MDKVKIALPLDSIMQLAVLTATGQTLALEGVSASTTIDTLKAMIQDTTGVPPSSQRLTFSKPRLQTHAPFTDGTLADYGIQDGSTLLLVVSGAAAVATDAAAAGGDNLASFSPASTAAASSSPSSSASSSAASTAATVTDRDENDLEHFEENLMRAYEAGTRVAQQASGGGVGGVGGVPRFVPNPLAERGERIVLASYPRSGNSLLRKLLETLTGTVTGSDTLPNRAMSEQLRDFGLVGESCTKSAWVIKTHFPERYGWKRFRAQRGLLLVRNPFNAIDSYFNMQLTATHTDSLEDGEFARHGQFWNRFVEEESVMWRRFHEYVERGETGEGRREHTLQPLTERRQ